MRSVTVCSRLQEVSEWFGNLGCKLPYGVNVADFILDLASGEFEDSRPMLGVMGSERKEKLIEVCLFHNPIHSFNPFLPQIFIP